MNNLVIVESPAKAKTINKYLGKDYVVIASYGHIRDLPSKNGSVKPDENFSIIYEISDKSDKHVKAISQAFKKADKVFLATDPDREGEAISWHIVEAMKTLKSIKKDQIIKRVTFHEITKKAVLAAINDPQEINIDLVNAQQARRALDYLVGFTLSPVLWRKLPGSKSAGRVQSVALRMICEREENIETFVTREYWTIIFDFITKTGEKLFANLTSINDKKLEKFDLNNENIVKETIKDLDKNQYIVENVEKKQIKRNPYPPFTTSSLQQEASRKLGFSAKHTMQIAQKLYEGIDIEGETQGLITYMRTDGVQIGADAVNDIRKLIKKDFGDKYLPDSPKVYKAKAKNAQEAHEAIRPTHIDYRPADIRRNLDTDQFKLYELIWKRTLACQMANAILDQVIITITDENKNVILRSTGSTIAFDGFYKLYRESLDDSKEEESKLLPKVNIGEKLKLEEIKPAQHFTEPPPRFSEASLVKNLEELGIGRPSTYASIISVLQERDYVKLDKKRFIPEERGRLVTAFLTSFFKNYVEYDFTASLENQLDLISAGELDWKKMLKDFWYDFEDNTVSVSKLEPHTILAEINNLLENHFFPPKEDGSNSKECPTCHKGTLSIKLGKFGAFAACSDYPECKYTRNIDVDSNSQDDEFTQISVDEEIGIDLSTGLTIYVKKGPYGPYLQLGEAVKGQDKPKRSPIPDSIDIKNLNIDLALKLLSLPRKIGINPETDKGITMGYGKFGPYLLHDGKYTSIDKSTNFLDIDLDQAMKIMAEAKPIKSSSNLIRTIGNHPDDDISIDIYDGRYGAYIKYKKLNATIPKNLDIETIDLEKALELIKIQEEKIPSKKKKTITKKPAAKKTKKSIE